MLCIQETKKEQIDKTLGNRNIHERIFLFPSVSASFLSLFSIALILSMIIAWSVSHVTPISFANSYWDVASFCWSMLTPSVFGDVSTFLFCTPCCKGDVSMGVLRPSKPVIVVSMSTKACCWLFKVLTASVNFSGFFLFLFLFEALAHLEQKPQEFHHPFVQLQLSCSVISPNELIEDEVHTDTNMYRSIK